VVLGPFILLLGFAFLIAGGCLAFRNSPLSPRDRTPERLHRFYIGSALILVSMMLIQSANYFGFPTPGE
jgi:hypothetical protein